MLLYDLVAEYNNYSVNGTVDNDIITFSLEFKDEKEANKMKVNIDLKELIAYGHKFTINSVLHQNILNIQLNSRVSG